MKRFLYAILTIVFALCICLMSACEAINDVDEPYPEFEQLPIKKGVSVSRYQDGSVKSAVNLENLGVSWCYNWGAEAFAANLNVEYVPMTWGKWNVNEKTLNSIREGYEEGKYNYLLTFNEPDYTSQSNISVETALELWPQLEALGMPLSSPAPAYYTSGWLDEFMEGAMERGYRVDFIALHCYQQFTDDGVVEKLRQQLIEIYEKYQLPIWITEFAAIDTWVWGGHTGDTRCTQETASKYTKDVTDMLESLGFVERYAWFIDNSGSSRSKEARYTYLYNDDDTISETGKVYKAQQSSSPLRIMGTLEEECSVGAEYSTRLYANGGTGKYTFSTEAPEGVKTWYELPKGLTLNSKGVISGIPEESGTFDISIAVEDSNGQMTFKYYKLTIEK